MIVNGDITQCDLPSGVKSGLSDAMSRFEEDEMIGWSASQRGLRPLGALPAHATSVLLNMLLCSRPGKPGFVFVHFIPSSRERVR